MSRFSIFARSLLCAFLSYALISAIVAAICRPIFLRVGYTNPVAANYAIFAGTAAGLLGAVLVGILVRAKLSPQNPQPGCCVKCGYNLTDNITGCCPECGHPTDSDR